MDWKVRGSKMVAAKGFLFSTPVQTRPYKGYRGPFQRMKQPKCGDDHPPRWGYGWVELYYYFPSVSAWHVAGISLPLHACKHTHTHTLCRFSSRSSLSQLITSYFIFLATTFLTFVSIHIVIYQVSRGLKCKQHCTSVYESFHNQTINSVQLSTWDADVRSAGQTILCLLKTASSKQTANGPHPAQSSPHTHNSLGLGRTSDPFLSVFVCSGPSSYDRLDIRTTWVMTKKKIVLTYDQSLELRPACRSRPLELRPTWRS
jgi:hypothetical protein